MANLSPTSPNVSSIGEVFDRLNEIFLTPLVGNHCVTGGLQVDSTPYYKFSFVPARGEYNIANHTRRTVILYQTLSIGYTSTCCAGQPFTILYIFIQGHMHTWLNKLSFHNNIWYFGLSEHEYVVELAYLSLYYIIPLVTAHGCLTRFDYG